MEKKKLEVNCVSCDMRGINKELLDNYEKITIHAGSVFMSRNTQVLTAPYDVQIDSANMIILEEDTEIIQHNGAYHIKAGDRIPTRKFYLCINGKLTIEAGTEEILKQCEGITVNGKLSCPAGVLAALSKVQVNGKTESYPDGAVLVDGIFCPDPVFVLRAKKKAYYASTKVVMTDGTLDVNALVQKGVHFITPRALIRESLLEGAISLFDDETEIKVLEEGMQYLSGDITLEKTQLKRHGARLFIDGSVRIESRQVLEELEKLQVNGTVRIKEELETVFLERGADIEYKELVVERGMWICDKISFRVEPKLFEKGEVHVRDVAKVTITPEVTEEQIMEKLELRDCAIIICTPEQSSAVEIVSEDVGKIDCGQKDGMAGSVSLSKEPSDTKVVNTSAYRF